MSGEILVGDCALQALPDVFRQNIRIPCGRRIVRQSLHDGQKVSDGDALLQKVLQYLLDFAEPQKLGHQLLHQRRIGLLHIVHQVLDILSAQQLIDMLPNDFRQMGGDDGRRIHHCVSQALRPFPLPLRDPDGRQMEGRLESRDARNLLLHIAGIHGHIMVEQNLAFTDLDAFDFDQVLIRVQLNIVAQADDGNQHTQLQRNLPTYHHNAVKQVSALVHVCQRNDSVAELQLDRIHLQQRGHILGLTHLLRGHFIAVHLALDCRRLQVAGNHPAAHHEGQAHSHEQNRIQIREHGKENQRPAHHVHDLRYAEQLLDDGRAEIRFLAALCHQHAGGQRDQQRGNLAHQAVTDGEDAVIVQRGHGIHIVAQHAHGKAAQQIDESQQKACDGVSLDILHGTVHGTEEAGFLLNLVTPLFRFPVIDGSCIQIGVNGHLLTGHGVQREPGRHLSHTLRTFVDDQELNHDQNDEYDCPDNQIAAAYELSESHDYVS